jgi:hypothetical protein
MFAPTAAAKSMKAVIEKSSMEKKPPSAACTALTLTKKKRNSQRKQSKGETKNGQRPRLWNGNRRKNRYV